jgi:thiol:disulfide interchange protein DsbD
VAIFFIAMSLSLFGVFEIHLSSRWAHRLHRLGGEGFRGAFLSGMGLGLIASPCSGPVIAALLGYVALQKSYLMGFALLVIYGLGMGIMILALGTAYGVVSDKLRSGPWMVWVKRSLGVLLLIPAAFYVGSLFHWKTPTPTKEMPAIEWVEDAKNALAFAGQSSRPIMMDFYANWCLPCRSLDRTFFTREDIVKLSYQLIPVRVDATYESMENRKLMDKYCVMGMPTVVFLAPDGTSYEDLKVISADERLLERNMKEAIRRARGNDERR